MIQLRYVGDVLVTTPALRALKQAFPDARIDFLVERGCRPVLEGNPHIDELITRDGKVGMIDSVRLTRRLRARGYDVVVDYQGTPGSGLITRATGAGIRIARRRPARGPFYTHLVHDDDHEIYMARRKIAMLEPLGVEQPAPSDHAALAPEMKVPDAARRHVDEFLERVGVGTDETLIAIDPTSRRETRRWTAEGFAELADRVASSRKARVVFLWGPGERTQVQRIIDSSRGGHLLAPPTDLFQLAALIQRCRLHVGNDSGPRHIAAACGTPTLTVIGSTNEGSWTLPGGQHRVVFEPVHCRPCLKSTCPTQLECMNQLSADKVARAASEFCDPSAS